MYLLFSSYSTVLAEGILDPLDYEDIMDRDEGNAMEDGNDATCATNSTDCNKENGIYTTFRA